MMYKLKEGTVFYRVWTDRFHNVFGEVYTVKSNTNNYIIAIDRKKRENKILKCDSNIILDRQKAIAHYNRLVKNCEKIKKDNERKKSLSKIFMSSHQHFNNTSKSSRLTTINEYKPRISNIDKRITVKDITNNTITEYSLSDKVVIKREPIYNSLNGRNRIGSKKTVIYGTDIENGIISTESELGKKLLYTKIGNKFSIKVGDNLTEYQVVNITNK